MNYKKLIGYVLFGCGIAVGAAGVSGDVITVAIFGGAFIGLGAGLLAMED